MNSYFVQVWDDPQKLPHERSSKVFMRLNFKLHVYFAIKVTFANSFKIHIGINQLHKIRFLQNIF